MQESYKGIILPFRQSHAFIIGINEYLHLSNLRTAVNDANKLAEVLEKEQKFKIYPPLLNAKRSDIQQLFEKTMPGVVEKDDRCLLYFAGHGIAEDSEDIPEGYIIPVDAIRDKVASYYSMKDLYAAIKNLKCRHFLLILDCCFSGAIKWSSRFRQIRSLMPKRIFKERYDRFVKDKAWQVITSTAHDQKAIDILEERAIGKRDDNEMNHSPFAEALFEGLQGAADVIPKGEGDGLITATELYLYLRDRVEPQTIAINENYRQTPAIFPLLEKHDKGEYVFINPRHPLTLDSNPGKSPYKGLQSFTETDKDLFYGRERVINDLIQKISKNNLVVVTGASGTGKSSVVKAGLIPALRQLGYDILPVIQPGITPVEFLKKVLRESNFYYDEHPFTRDKYSISNHITLHKTVLVIDQFEELITQFKEKDRNRFIHILKKHFEANQENLLKIILTVRADFEPQLKSTELEPYWPNARYPLPPLTTGELREIIVKPIVQVVMEFEPLELVDRIIEEVIQAPGTLPLLSFTLDELFQSYISSGRTDRALHEEDYKKLGGVIGALYTTAENLYKALDRSRQETLHKIMLRMVSIEGSEPARKKILMDELIFSKAEENKRVEDIIDKLLKARLVIKDNAENNQNYVEPVHDALINSWVYQRGWLNDDGKEIILLQNRLGAAIKDDSIGKGNLWHNHPRLDQLEKESKSQDSWLNQKEVIFVKDSIRFKKRKKNRAWTIAISVIVILFALSIFAFFKAKEARKEARIAQANSYITQAQAKLNQHPSIPLRLAERAYYLDNNPTVQRVLSTAAAYTLEHPLYNLNLQHPHHVNDATFSPSGDRILTASSDKTARLWDLNGHTLVTFKHEKEVGSCEFSPSGDKILTVSRDNSAHLWDLHGRLLKKLPHPWIVTSGQFSPDGRLILTTCEENPAALWNWEGHLLGNFDPQEVVTYAAFSPDSLMVLTVSDDNRAKLWNTKGDVLAQFDKHRDLFTSAQFSPDGTKILTTSRYTPAKLWDLAGNICTEFTAYRDYVSFARFSPDGTAILMAYTDGTAKIWDFQGNLLGSLKHNDKITSVSFSPNGDFILTASLDKTAKMWNLSGNLVYTFDMHTETVNSAVFSPDGNKILTASKDFSAKLWDLRDQLIDEFTCFTNEVTFADFSPDGKTILAVSRDNIVRVLDLHHKHEVVMNKHTWGINTASFSPNGNLILTSSIDNTAKLWNKRGELLHDLNLHTDNVNSAAFSPDGKKILTASFDGTAKIWDLDGHLLINLAGHQKALTSAEFSPDGQKIITASYDKTARLWDLKGNCLNVFKYHSFTVESAHFSPDNTMILTVSVTALLWNLKGRPLAEFDSKIDPNNRKDIQIDFGVGAAFFSPDSSRILTVTKDHTTKLWNVKGRLKSRFNAHTDNINYAEFSPDGTLIITASKDKTAKLWDLDGNMLANFVKHKDEVNSAVFSPDGSRILTASADKTVKIRYCPQAIIRWLKKSKIPNLESLEKNLK